MKKNQFIKFSLTLVCAGVLAACHSSGNKDDDAQKRAQEQAQKQREADAAKAKAEAEKAKKLAQETEKELKLQKQLSSTGDHGGKFVKKTNSNLVTNQAVEAANSKSSTSITGMTVPLYPSLDTIVVATPVDKNGKALSNAAQIYLEDFDFRGNDRDVAKAAGTPGRYTLKHIYNIGAAENDENPRAPSVDKATIGKTKNAGVARNPGFNEYTKTDRKGQQEGIAFVYENGRLNYTKKVEGVDVLDKRTARTEFKKNGFASTGRLDESVAEVYGHRTFVTGDSESGRDNGEYNVSNAPFVAAGKILNAATNPSAADTGVRKVGGKDEEYTAGGKLKYVQYGRVTSQLDEVNIDDLAAGKNIVTLGTKIASYGGYGDQGTEDHYFYRGVSSTPYSTKLASDLAATYFGKTGTPSGVLDYRGHAVTYNLDRDLKLGDKVPNAIGYTHHLVSGTHVNAKIDLATSAVTGRLYNVWAYSNGQENGKVTDELASFSGKLANNGSIAGSSTRLNNDGTKNTGTLVASLFGPKGEELGGTISSDDTINNWGASFGAALQNAGPAGEKPALGESTDQGNLNNPNIGK